jgi:Lrp/AsnC family leucine-responsive transcriptional regulator
MKLNLDEIDLSILEHMRRNAKQPLKELAREMGVHNNTLLQRIKKLERSGIIKNYVASIDYPKAGFDLHVVIMMKIVSGRPGDVSQFGGILKMKELEALYATTGGWDAVSMWRVRDREHLNDVIRRLAGCKAISDTDSHVVLYSYREPEEFNPFGKEQGRG